LNGTSYIHKNTNYSHFDAVKKCIKNLARKYQYIKYKEIYEIDLDLLKEDCANCDDLINSFKKFEKKIKKGGEFHVIINK